MERRDLLKLIAAASGAAFVGNALAWDPAPSATTPAAAGFSKDDLGLLSEIAETIIPRTDTPGAKDAGVAETMAILVADCYTPTEQKAFYAGMKQIDKDSNADFGKPFLLLSKQQKEDFLSNLNQTAYAYNSENGIGFSETGKPSTQPDSSARPPHYFTMFKQLVLFSFFTSEIGATKVLRYVAIPGRYDGAYPYQRGDRAWAT